MNKHEIDLLGVVCANGYTEYGNMYKKESEMITHLICIFANCIQVYGMWKDDPGIKAYDTGSTNMSVEELQILINIFTR